VGKKNGLKGGREMNKYIDADLLLAKLPDDLPYKASVKRVLTQAPTADVVEVVRCKDCFYYREENSYCMNPHCSSSFYGHRVKENHYCSYGERREG
jgi:hypothetical protein